MYPECFDKIGPVVRNGLCNLSDQMKLSMNGLHCCGKLQVSDRPLHSANSKASTSPLIFRTKPMACHA